MVERTAAPSLPCDFAGFTVTRDHAVLADADGVLFIPLAKSDELLEGAAAISATESRQAAAIRAGTTLRTQLHWPQYLDARKTRPSYTFREHLADMGGAIEV